MKRAIVWLILVILAAGAAVPACAQEEEASRVIVATDAWTPPDLSSLTSADAPELLLLKMAQEEIGYTEGPQSNETKYGEWFCGGRVAWCAEFITWCVDQVDQRYGTALMNDLFPWYGGPSTGAPFFIEKGRFISDDGKLPSNEKQWLIGSDHYLEADEYVPYPATTSVLV
jgi:hypothetical protein